MQLAVLPAASPPAPCVEAATTRLAGIRASRLNVWRTSVAQETSGDSGILENLEIPIRCTQRGRELREKVSTIKSCDALLCPCGFAIDTSALRAKARFVAEAIEEFSAFPENLRKTP